MMQDTEWVEQAVLDHLTDDPGQARAWLERGRAMLPAYRGRPEHIVSYVDGLLARGDDLEASVYAGFAAYMLALTGRHDDCQPLLDALRRLTRRHATAFDVGSVGNGYAAAIVSETLTGNLRAAVDRGRRPVPNDPSFSITSATALAHVALLTKDLEAMRRAIEWTRLGSIPILGYLTPFSEMCHAFSRGGRPTPPTSPRRSGSMPNGCRPDRTIRLPPAGAAQRAPLWPTVTYGAVD